MFGHPGISALEYAGRAEGKKKQNTCPSEVSLRRRSTTSTPNWTIIPGSTTDPDPDRIEVLPPVTAIEEFRSQQRRKGNFVNHTPRNFEMRPKQPIEVYQPTRAESGDYSRPLSRQSSTESTGPGASDYCRCDVPMVKTTADRPSVTFVSPAGSDDMSSNSIPTPPPFMHSKKSHRRSISAPQIRLVTNQQSPISTQKQPPKEASVRSASSSVLQSQDKKRRRRQTPYKVQKPELEIPRYAPLDPWVAKHQRKRTSDTIGDVPFDMDREVSMDVGTFGVIQRYFDSQKGGPVSSPTAVGQALSSNPPDLPPLRLSDQKAFKEPIAIYPIDELDLSNEPPPVPDRSPKRLTNPAFPMRAKCVMSVDSDFNFATEGQYSPYHHKNEDILNIPKKRSHKRISAGQAAQAGSSCLGKMAPPILGHQALTASSDLGLNDLSYYLKHTGPSPEPQPAAKLRKKNGMRLFKAKQRKTLAARVGSVEGSPQRVRRQNMLPACTREMTTSAGARHLKIIIPTETPRGSQAIALPLEKSRTTRRSRHLSITFTEEMLNPLASPQVERLISDLSYTERSVSAPLLRSPRSPKRSPNAPKAIPVIDHPLALTREESTRARKLRDLQRIKRKPLPDHTVPEKHHLMANALLTPAQTPEPVAELSDGLPAELPASTHGRASPDKAASPEKVEHLHDKVVELQKQNSQLTEALAKIVGLQLDDGDVKSEDVLEAFKKMKQLQALAM